MIGMFWEYGGIMLESYGSTTKVNENVLLDVQFGLFGLFYRDIDIMGKSICLLEEYNYLYPYVYNSNKPPCSADIGADPPLESASLGQHQIRKDQGVAHKLSVEGEVGWIAFDAGIKTKKNEKMTKPKLREYNGTMVLYIYNYIYYGNINGKHPECYSPMKKLANARPSCLLHFADSSSGCLWSIALMLWWVYHHVKHVKTARWGQIPCWNTPPSSQCDYVHIIYIFT